MWKINRPPTLNEAISDIPDVIAASKRRQDKEKHLDAKADALELAILYTAYHQQGGSVSQEQHDALLTPKKAIGIKELYPQTYDSDKAWLPKIRPALTAGVTHCPYCGFGEPITLDHYLPKSKFGSLATCRINLIPACYRCNKLKNEDTTFAHPYYDSFPPKVEFFKCEVKWVSPFFTFRYWIDASVISPDLNTKLSIQTDTIKLNSRILKEVNSFLAEELAGTLGLSSVKLKRIIALKISYYETNFGMNHWKTAALRGLAKCADFTAANLAVHLGLNATRDAII